MTALVNVNAGWKPVTSRENILAAARTLHESRSEGRCCPPVREFIAAGDVAGAYAVQEENTQRWIGEGRRVVGRKIGLTARSVQQALKIDSPNFGMLFSDMEVAPGETVGMKRLLQPRVEGELAFVLGGDLTTSDPTMADVIRAVEFVLPAIEIVDSRIADWDLQLVDTIADNASSGLYALGTEPKPLGKVDLELCGMVLEKNGEPVSFGAGLACLGHPLAAVRWLAQTMVTVGQPLSAGDIVLSGALGPLVPVGAGDLIEVRISGAGPVSLRFGQE